MKVKDRLEKIRKMDNMIDLRLDNLKEQRNKLYKITSVIRDKEVQESNNTESPLEKSIIRLITEEEEVNSIIDRFIDYKKEILEIISSIENDDYRKILYLKYFKYLDYLQISEEMGYSERTVYRLDQKAVYEYWIKEIGWFCPELS